MEAVKEIVNDSTNKYVKEPGKETVKVAPAEAPEINDGLNALVKAD